MTNERKLRRVRVRNSQQKEKGHCFAVAPPSPHQNLNVLMCVNTPLKWNIPPSGKNLYLSVISMWYSFWPNCGENHLFLPASFLPCYSLYLHSLTSSTLKLPHCRCSGSAFPNIKPTHAFSSFYIPLSSLSSASSFIPSSRAYWHKPCGCRPERKMMVVGTCFQHWPGFSERVLLGWQVKSAETWVVMLELC